VKVSSIVAKIYILLFAHGEVDLFHVRKAVYHYKIYPVWDFLLPPCGGAEEPRKYSVYSLAMRWGVKNVMMIPHPIIFGNVTISLIFGLPRNGGVNVRNKSRTLRKIYPFTHLRRDASSSAMGMQPHMSRKA
jgi:hypothetical protein